MAAVPPFTSLLSSGADDLANSQVNAAPQYTGSHPITFRGVTFASIEHPSTFGIGAREHMISVGKIPGGTIITDAWGTHPDEVAINGWIYNARVRTIMPLLQSYVDDALEGPLTWSRELWYGRARKIEPGYRHEFTASFVLTIVVTRSGNGSLKSATVPTADEQATSLASDANDGVLATVASSNSNDLISNTASGQAASATMGATAFSSIGAVAQALLLTGPLAQAPSSGISALGGVVTAAIGSVGSYASLFKPSSGSALALTSPLNQLSILRAVVANGQSVKTVSQTGGTLFDVAATVYGSAAHVGTLLDANPSIASPFLPSGVSTTIVVPPQPAAL